MENYRDVAIPDGEKCLSNPYDTIVGQKVEMVKQYRALLACTC